MIETLLLEIGGTVSGVILRLWLEDSEVAASATAEVDQLIERFVPDRRERRALRRELERISEQIADRLEPFFDVEFGGLPENEKVAAGHLVGDTLAGAPLSDDLLFATDLEPLALEAEIRKASPQAAERQFLSAAGTLFYDVLLREITNYIVEIRITLPDFGSQSARVILQRETELIELVKQILDRLPIQESGLGSGEVVAFEAQYRRDAARRLDQLQLFGLTTSETAGRYPLSVAYLTLNASARLDRLVLDDEGGDRRPAGEEDRASIPVDEALGRCNRVLVRGEAGSGKTTLLQWLAVNSARRSFAGELAKWNDSVPYLVALRRFVDEDLPSVSDFAAAVNQQVTPPDGWVRDRLQAGTAIVLVDGIDELPEEKREAARRWLSDLVVAYPDAKYVVTSRPPAVSEDWLDGEGFESVVLESMGVSAIGAFIDHWHTAVAATVADDEARELGELATDLKDGVRETRSIRNLASSPLLCAMLCALNRDRHGRIPPDRIELYRVALEMLLDRRDAERRVTAGIARLGLPEKEILLRGFALWLLNNGRSDATIDDLVALVEDRLPAMVRVKASAEDVAKNLLLRSGLLREPIEGRVDFIHRTFQEYLAAKEAVVKRPVETLLEHAHLDQWQEVVVLAAGLAPVPVREELIDGLIKRGNRDRANKHRLHLLAVGCLETSAELSPELTARVEALLQRLIPPHNLTEAKSISSAGDLATRRLGEYAKGSKAAVAAACVRALSLIGGESALVQLEKFGPDRRVTVARELLRGWQEFPSEEYARRVLASSPLDYGSVWIAGPDQLEGIAAMEKATALRCDGTGVGVPTHEWPWGALAGHPALATVSLTAMPQMLDLPDLKTIPKLSTLNVASSRDLTRLSAGALPDVERLTVEYTPRLINVEGIADLERLKLLQMEGAPNLSHLPRLPATLERLVLSDVGISSLGSLEGCEALEVLVIEECMEIADIAGLAEIPGIALIEIFDARRLVDVSPIGSIRDLEGLAIRDIAGFGGVSELANCVKLLELGVEGSANLSDVGWLEPLTGLQTLSLSGCPALTGFPRFDLPELRQLILSGCRGITDLEWVAHLPALQRLYIGDCVQIDDLSPLAALPELQRLEIANCSAITDSSVLMELPELRWLDARGCSEDLALDALEEERGVLVWTGPPVRLVYRNYSVPAGIWGRYF
ncbi:MAG TPA: NACHT domain-containing protein [Solirubrobacterales bacterium]|nr:NACHT domain-containing protein [Solirubrobacterales bacterium]